MRRPNGPLPMARCSSVPTLAVRLAARGGRRTNGQLGGLGVAARGGAAGRL